MRFFFLCLLLCLFSFVSPLQGETAENEQGTLIVTYQTNSEGDRLDLIRFWLINSDNERTLYPQKNEAVSSHCSANERTVVISSLPIGRYKIEFLFPNKDHVFEDVLPRDVVLEANQIVKIDQIISLHSLPSDTKKNFSLALLNLNEIRPLGHRRPIYPPRPFPSFRPWPSAALQSKPIGSATFSLKSNKRAGWRLMLGGHVLYSGQGSISTLYLPPGRQYYLLTENLPGYRVYTAPRSPFDLFPNQILSMEVFYQFQMTPLEHEKKIPSPPFPPTLLPLFPPAHQEKTGPPLKGKLRVLTDSSQAIFSLKTESETIIGQGQGYYYLFEDLNPGYYLLDFSNVELHLIPFSSREQIEIQPNQIKEIKMHYQRVKSSPSLPSQPQPIAPLNQSPATTQNNKRIAIPLVQESLLEVPAGIALIDDRFLNKPHKDERSREVEVPLFYIGTYPVTNAQYADWLNQALKEKKITWDSNQPGHLISTTGQLLCKTVEGSPLAQLITQGDANQIMPIPGKENHPIIEVTWQGANSYCQNKSYRLPTAIEWEKAAGMAFPKNGKGQRFLYGFGRNDIDRTWANYRDRPTSRGRQQVLTTPVGFYDGMHTLPLRTTDRKPIQTHNAKSPIGAYDMSGNVWEWVADNPTGPSTHHMVKGGSYDSPAEEVRVSAQLVLPPAYSDVYTGFRIAK